jgi:hypothetical protein
MRLFKRIKALSALSARQLAKELHDAGRTDQQIADAIGASRSQVTKIRNGQESGTLLRPRLLALMEGRMSGAYGKRQLPQALPHGIMPARSARRVTHPVPQSQTTPERRVQLPTRPQLQSLTADDVGTPDSHGGRQIGWIGPDEQVVKQPPAEYVSRGGQLAPAASRGRADTRALLRRGYDALRTAGLSDTEAQAILAPLRELAHRQAAPQTQQSEPDFVPFLAQAEHELRTGNNAGLWTTADVVARARALARQDTSRRQTLRLPDPEPKLLAASMSKQVPRVAYLSGVQTGRIPQPAGSALGNSLAAMREDIISQVSDIVTVMFRQSAQQAPSPAEAPTMRTPPALGTPATLGAPVRVPDYLAR